MLLPVHVILVGLAVFTIFLVALFKSGRTVRRIFAVLVLPVLLLLFYFFMQQPRVIVRPESSVAIPVTEALVHSPAADPMVWQADLEKELVPDVYSSLAHAAYGLGRQLQETIQEALWQSPAEILIAETSSLDKSDLNEFREGLKSQYEEADIYFGPLPADPVPAGKIRITVSQSKNKEREIILSAAGSEPFSLYLLSGNTGRVEAAIETEKGKYYKSASFDYRPWLWDFNSFASEIIPSCWMVSVSDETAAGRQEARDQAIGKAICSISSQLRNTNPSSMALAHITQEDLLQKGFIADEYSQRLAGLAGPIWRYAILLDVSPERLHVLSAAQNRIDRQTRLTWAKTLGSLAGMMALVCLVYVVANAATKGYYSTVMAVTAFAAVVILGIIIIWVI